MTSRLRRLRRQLLAAVRLHETAMGRAAQRPSPEEHDEILLWRRIMRNRLDELCAVDLPKAA